MNRPGGQTVGPRVQLSGLKRLASRSGTLWGESASTSGERSSGKLPFGQSLVSVPTPVLRQDPIQQESTPIGRGGHEVVFQTHRPSSSDCLSSLPVKGNHPSSSPSDGHCPLGLSRKQLHPWSSPGDGYCPLGLPRMQLCPSSSPADDLDLGDEIPSDVHASQDSAGNDGLFVSEDNSVSAGCKKINNAAAASWVSAGTSHARSLGSWDSQ